MGKHRAPRTSSNKLVPVMGTALALSAGAVVVPTVIASNSETELSPSSDTAHLTLSSQRGSQGVTMSSLTLPEVSPGALAGLATERASQAAQAAARPAGITTDKNGEVIAVGNVVSPPEVKPSAKPKPTVIVEDKPPLVVPKANPVKVKPAPRPQPALSCSANLARTQPHVAAAGQLIRSVFGFQGTILGRGARSTPGSDHPKGLALDFMVPGNTVLGNQIAAYVLANQDKLNVKYVIWRQRYNDGSGWERMGNRGSVTANHYDHVHISFNSSGRSPC